MKRFLCIMIAALLLYSLSGCHYSDSGDILEPVSFYYPRSSANFVYGASDGVIAAEVREASGHTDDLTYLLSMYLYGPLNPDLRSPFPAECKLLDVYKRGDSLTIRLSPAFTTLENLELTTACAALAKTCQSISNAQYISIYSASEVKTIAIALTADSLQFVDNSTLESSSNAE